MQVIFKIQSHLHICPLNNGTELSDIRTTITVALGGAEDSDTLK